MSLRNIVVLLALGTVAAVAVFFATRKPKLGPEAEVRATLARGVKAAEDKDLGALLDVVSDRFHGRGMDKQSLKGMLFAELHQAAWRRVVLTGTEVHLAGPTTADVTTRAALAQGDGIVPKDADVYTFSLTLEKEDDGEWRVVRADYRRGITGSARGTP